METEATFFLVGLGLIALGGFLLHLGAKWCGIISEIIGILMIIFAFMG